MKRKEAILLCLTPVSNAYRLSGLRPYLGGKPSGPPERPFL